MLLPALVVIHALAAPPTPESLIAGFREVDKTPVSLVGATLPEGATLSAHVTPKGAITIRRTLTGKKLDLLVITPRPDKKGALDHEILVEITRRDGDGAEPKKLACSGHVATSTRYQPALFLRCYPDASFAKGAKIVTQMTLELERETLDIGEGPVHYRAPRVAMRIELKKAAWRRILDRVNDKAGAGLTPQVAPHDTNGWSLMPDTTARVTVDRDAVRATVAYVGPKATAEYRLEGLVDWLSFEDERVMALRLTPPDGQEARVCPAVVMEAKKKPFDISGPAFTFVGPCYRGLTKALFERAKGSDIGLHEALPGTTKDGWIQLVVNEQRLMILTAPGPKAHPDTWVRVDSAK